MNVLNESKTLKLELSDADIISMDDNTGNITVGFIENVSKDDIVEIHFKEDEPNISHKYRVSLVDGPDSAISLDWIEMLDKTLTEELLIEEPVIKFDDSELVTPTESPIKTAMSRAVEQDRIEKEKKEKEEQETALKVKYQDIISLFAQEAKTEADPLVLLDMLFTELVPPSGAADTQAGELVRAIVRIMYRDNNDGDKFFEGYGIETCGSSAEYLYDNGFESEIQAMIDNMYQLVDDDNKYTEALNHIAAKIVERIKTEPELIYTPNTEDSRDYSNDYIKENQPRYEYEIVGSDDLVTLVENGTLTSWDLNDYVENILSYERDYEGAKVGRPWSHHDTSVTVENLTRDGYDRLKDSVEHNLDEFWSDLVNEHIDDLESDDELDDNYDSTED